MKKEKKQSKNKNYLLVITKNGYGKRTNIEEYRLQGRGGSGIKSLRINEKTGDAVFSKVVGEDSGKDLIIISEKGQVIRTSLGSISVVGRVTSGVRVMKLSKEDKVMSAICL